MLYDQPGHPRLQQVRHGAHRRHFQDRIRIQDRDVAPHLIPRLLPGRRRDHPAQHRGDLHHHDPHGRCLAIRHRHRPFGRPVAEQLGREHLITRGDIAQREVAAIRGDRRQLSAFHPHRRPAQPCPTRRVRHSAHHHPIRETRPLSRRQSRLTMEGHRLPVGEQLCLHTGPSQDDR